MNLLVEHIFIQMVLHNNSFLDKRQLSYNLYTIKSVTIAKVYS